MRKRKDGLFRSNWILGFQFKNVKETVRNWGKWWIVCFIIIITLRNWRKWWNLKIKISKIFISFLDFQFYWLFFFLLSYIFFLILILLQKTHYFSENIIKIMNILFQISIFSIFFFNILYDTTVFVFYILHYWSFLHNMHIHKRRLRYNYYSIKIIFFSSIIKIPNAQTKDS